MALLQRFSLVVLLFTLVACGGSEGGFGNLNPDTDPEIDPQEDVVTVTLSISDANVSDASPATVFATVLLNGNPLEGQIVSFEIIQGDFTLASLSPAIGTSLTNANGVAEIQLNAGNDDGSGQVRAVFVARNAETEEDVEFSGVIAFNSAGDANTGTTPDVSNISLFTSSPQLASSGAQEITLTAIAKDDSNNLLEGVAISFAASSGGIQTTTGLTGPDGKATAILSTNVDKSNRVIIVTASTAQFSDTVNIEVVGTTVQLTGSSSLAINDTNEFTIRVLDSDGEGVGNALVNLSTSDVVTSGDVATVELPQSITTGSTGLAQISVRGTSGGSNAIIATALGATVSQSVTVQADSFLFSGFNDGNGTNINLTTQSLDNIPDVLLSDAATITLTWTREGVPVSGVNVDFTATRGTLTSTSATTNVNGQVSTSLSSSNAGKSLVSFKGVDGDVSLNNQLEFEFVAETAATINAQASPKSIGPNDQQSTISVVVKDPTGNLVKNKEIIFELDDVTGGEISPATAITDSNGTASTVYTSNTISSQDGVTITSTVQDTPTVNDSVTLTVADRELFISLGTGNTLEEIDITNYNKQFSVFVTDVDSTPVSDVELTVSAVPKTFYKGRWIRLYDIAGTFVRWITVSNIQYDIDGNIESYDGSFACSNEDVNINAILDAGEDTNGDGALTPGNVVAALGNIVTDEQGKAIIDIRYPQSYGSWVDIDLIVSAKVNGTENQTQTTFTLSTSSEDISDEDVTPPTSSIGVNSPFGYINNCVSAN